MSGAAAGMVTKVLTGAIAGKVVGKVTGNDKLGMLAALGTGVAVNGGAVAEKGGGLLSTASKWAEDNPTSSKIAGGLVGGAASGAYGAYASKKEQEAAEALAKKEYERDIELLTMKSDLEETARSKDYARTHQMPIKDSAPQGLLSQPTPDPASYYYNNFKSLYSGGVR